MNYKVSTFIENTKINSEEIILKNKSVYEVINKYIRAKDNETNNNEFFDKRVMNL